MGHFGDDFYRSDDQTNSVKALKEISWSGEDYGIQQLSHWQSLYHTHSHHYLTLRYNT